MTERQITYVTEGMLEAQRKWGPSRTSYPITTTDIRRWAMATYYPERPPPIYWDEEYAATTRWKTIIAPPDFNPFAWTLTTGAPTKRSGPSLNAQPRHPEGKPLTGLNGGQTDTYGVPMRPGDVVSARSRLLDWNEREGRFGHTIYVRTEIEWKNQTNELVRTRISTSIRY